MAVDHGVIVRNEARDGARSSRKLLPGAMREEVAAYVVHGNGELEELFNTPVRGHETSVLSNVGARSVRLKLEDKRRGG